MSNYVNHGAIVFGNHRPTKGMLKNAMRTAPETVTLYSTSAFGPNYSTNGAQLDASIIYTIVGPDPYNNRKWYATIKVNANGKVMVS